MLSYRELTDDDMDSSIFAFFDRTQNVTARLTKTSGEWRVEKVSFIDNWSESDYSEGIRYLKTVIDSGGYVVAAFDDGRLKGFASVEPAVFGTSAKYMDLSNLHVSRDMRRRGVGRELFLLAKQWARDRQAQKLYISAHSAVESQAFYRAMGCVEAAEYNVRLAEKEPFDCQLECVL